MVSNLARPGGNITGFSYMSTDLAAKRLELLNETFSRSARIAILYNPDELATVLEMQETEGRCPHQWRNVVATGGPSFG